MSSKIDLTIDLGCVCLLLVLGLAWWSERKLAEAAPRRFRTIVGGEVVQDFVATNNLCIRVRYLTNVTGSGITVTSCLETGKAW